MPGETILIVEDSPESLKYAANVLRKEGYRVTIASTAEQALSTLRFLRPELILVDFGLPGMNGLELTARIKQDPLLRKSLVVALTASHAPEDEAHAREVGCDGYLTKPIEAHVLAGRIRDFLEFGKDTPGAYEATPAPAPGQGMKGLPDEEFAELRESFLKGGKGVSRHLLASLDGQFDSGKASRTVHQWVGSAGLLEFPAIASRAGAVETMLRTPGCTLVEVRGPMTTLARAFYNPSGRLSESGAQAAVSVLQGKRVALVGLSGDAADLICGALEQVGARARLFEPTQSPYDEAVAICHLIVVHVRPGNMICRWFSKDAPALPALPTIFFGAPEDIVSLSPQLHARAGSLLIEGCLAEEVLMRFRLAMTQPAPPPARVAAGDQAELVVACGDTALHPVIASKMKEHGLRCRLAANGVDTILMLRHVHPPIAVVDVHIDGFEALAAIRAGALPVRSIFITSPTHEDEVLRGYSLGAEDYLVQPFTPLELVARLKRLLG